MRRLLLTLLLAAVPAGAQPPAADGAPYARARRLVSDGNGAAGRAVVDSMLAAATPGTPAYAEALFWRATFAERSADAEQDYRRLAVEYSFSPRGADALVRLAQLDLVRGQAQAARDHLERLLRDYLDGASQARGRYWLARVHLGAGDQRAACTALDAAARTAVPGTDVARQIAALRPRVPNCETLLATRPPVPTPGSDTARATPTTPTSPTTPAPATTARAARQFTVQVAAYSTRSGADALAASLTRRGYPARVAAPNGDRPPFRVRIGRFATRQEASALLRELHGKRISGLLTEAEPEREQ